MTTEQMFFALGGLMVTLQIAQAGFFKYYIDAKLEPVAKQVDLLVKYMVDHESRISRLEERTK
ncbi:MAG: hypothetical protein ABWY12_09645 [Burkholderiales bacterium]